MRPRGAYEIVVIDDDPLSVTLVEEYLSDPTYRVVGFTSPRAGLAYLEAGHPVHAIILDRMMAELDGIALVAAARRVPRLRTVPILMQSAAVTAAEVAEGIAAGVFYYLNKPFARGKLLAILGDALRIYAIYDEVSAALSSLHRGLQTVVGCQLALRTLDEVDDTAVLISQIYPDPGAVALGVRELVLNAIEHGNAGITYDEKSALHRAGTWHDEVVRRLALAENRAKQVTIELRRGPTEIVLAIEDCGPGFNFAAYLELDPERFTDSHGRGIALSRLTSFDAVDYVGPGNKVICTKRLVR